MSEDSGLEWLPIERGFPISEVSALAEREARAKLHYRPLTTMHKWWARQPGSVFRAICLYTLLADGDGISVHGTGEGETSLSQFSEGNLETEYDLEAMIEEVDLEHPSRLWSLYPEEVHLENTSVLDPFMGGGTSLLEASRFGAAVTGVDLNPVAWFITKKEFEAAETELDTLQEAFERVESAVKEELTEHYRTGCPNDAAHTADIVYTLWVRTLDCISCDETVPLFKNYRVAKGRYGETERHHVACPECSEVFLTEDTSTESVCPHCSNEFVPDLGPVSQGGKYGCPACGLKYPIVDAIADGQSYGHQMYAIEYYCTECEDAGEERATYKGYKSPSEKDIQRYQDASEKWDSAEHLLEYVPTGEIPEGAITAASSISGNDVFQHGFERWQDMFNERQLYCLSTLLKAIDEIEKQSIREFLLLAFSDSLLFQNNLARYSSAGSKIEGILGRNSYTPRGTYAENNVWGTRAGRGTFTTTWQKITDAVEFAHGPTERYLTEGTLNETEPFESLIGGEFTLYQGDMRDVPLEEEYDAVITDPPYYDNVVYSEVSDFFYVWQRLLLAGSYDCFEPPTTPRRESIVSNPAVDKDERTFENELGEAFGRINEVLTDDGALVFTYRNDDAESWGGLVDAVCSQGFDITAMYPISGNASELFGDDGLNVTVIVVARPAAKREPTSWSALRRQAHRTAKQARDQLERSDQSLSEGEMALVELGRCLREYSRHHGQVHHQGEIMTPVSIVDEFQQLVSGDVTVDDIYLSLLEMESPSDRDLRRLCYSTDVSPATLREKGLISTDPFTIEGWTGTARREYLENTPEEEYTTLDLIHALRAEAEATTIGGQDREFDVTTELLELARELATLTGDDGYRGLIND